jgi:hypothetical protein
MEPETRKGKKNKKDPLAIATDNDRYPKWWMEKYAPQLLRCVRSAKNQLRYISIIADVNPYGPDSSTRQKSARKAYDYAVNEEMLSVEASK